jgi:hypothetical protein
MMRQGHYAAAGPIATTSALGLAAYGAPALIALACGALVMWSSTWNDLDHPRFKGKMHPGAALVRGTGRLGYLIRTDLDKQRGDVHRGPSHCVEWCLLVGAAFGALTLLIPMAAPYAVFWASAIALGTFSHVLADSMTPSGVPLCATYNYFRYGEVWRRHTLNWFSTDSGAERFGAVPVLHLISALVFLYFVGLLEPIVGWLVGGL